MNRASAVMIVAGLMGAIVSLLAHNLITTAGSILLCLVGVYTLA